MRRFHFRLAEENRTFTFSADARGRHEYSLAKRCGLQEREYAGEWRSRSLEVGTAKELARELNLRDWPPRRAGPFERLYGGALLLETRLALENFLERLGCSHWRIVFRARSTERAVVRSGGHKVAAVYGRLNHFSVGVSARPKGVDGELETSEGSTAGFRFNLDGLCQRLAEMTDNSRRCVPFKGTQVLPVVLAPGEGGIFFHEILGHSLEADHVHAGLSPFGPQDLGRAVTAPSLSVVTRDGRDRFFQDCPADDEGETPHSPLLVENGMLRQFISDSFHRRLLSLGSAGHARTEDFTRVPQPRMFALYVQPGSSDADEIIASTGCGVYAREFGAGRVDFDKDFFYFHISDSSLIDNGRLVQPLGPLLVSGSIRRVMAAVEMVGNDFRYDRGVSHCTKNGQVILVRVGQPTVKIAALTVSEGVDA